MQTPSVSRRNARERNRVKQVNNGFHTLRTHIPHLKNKTSKVDTLRAAVDYIQALRNLIGEPLKDQELYQGPVLITEIEEQRQELRNNIILCLGKSSVVNAKILILSYKISIFLHLWR